MVPWLLELRLVRAPRAGPSHCRAHGRAEATADQGQIRSVAKSDDTMDQWTRLTRSRSASPGGLERWPKPDRAAYRGAFLERSLASFSLGLTTTLLSGRKH